MSSVLNQAYFRNEAAAFDALERIMWPDGNPPHCPHRKGPGKDKRRL